MGTKRFLAVLGIVTVSCATALAQVRYTVTDLGTNGYAWSFGTDITNAGKVIVRTATSGGGIAPSFLWDDGTVSDLGNFEGKPFRAEAINEYGQIAGRVRVASYYHPFLWEDGVLTDLGTLGGTEGGIAFDINDAGQIAGWSRIESGEGHAFLWTPHAIDGIPSNPQMKDLGPTKASGINQSGRVAGHTWLDSDTMAFVWQDGSRTELGLLGQHGQVEAISDEGTVVGYTWGEVSGYRAFVWRDGVSTEFETESWAYDINNVGQVVGQFREGQGTFRAALWENGVLFDLNDLISADSEWTLTSANAINDAGQIVGYGRIGESTDLRAYLLVPEPATLSLLAVGGLLLIRKRRAD